jgi:penicillin-binding protein 1A
MAYMANSLKGVPEVPLKTPEGVVVARINADTGMRESEGGVTEYFYAEFPPHQREDALAPPGVQAPREVRNQLF